MNTVSLWSAYLRKDTATTHSQVKSMQQALAAVGFDTKRADGQFGANTLAAVKAPQSASGLTVAQYKTNRDSIAAVPANTYDKIDCSGFTYKARNNQGYHGATANFNQHCKYFGYIAALGGYDKLVPDMELYQAQRKNASSNQYAGHVGVMPVSMILVTGNFGSLAVKYFKNKGENGNRNGPNLSSMSSVWNYWAWSKYVKK